jgi:hypothetical protein
MSTSMDTTFVRVLSQTNWEEVASLQLDQDEVGCSITSVEHPVEDGVEVGPAWEDNSSARPVIDETL